MDSKSKENLDRILRVEPEALSPGDIEFLKARRSYLTASDLERYLKVLGPVSSDESQSAEPAKPAKKK